MKIVTKSFMLLSLILALSLVLVIMPSLTGFESAAAVPNSTFATAIQLTQANLGTEINLTKYGTR